MFTDPFGSRLLGSNIPSLTVQNWLRNPVVQGKCIFDHMYALEAEECLMKAQSLIGKFIKSIFSFFALLRLQLFLFSSTASATHRRGNLASLLKAKASLNTNKIAPAPTPTGAIIAGANASAPSSRASSPGKSTKRKSSSRKSKNKIAPAPLQIATGLEEPSWIEDGDSFLAINLESPSQFSTAGNLESPSRLSTHTFEPHASLASTVAQGALDYGSNPFASPSSKLNEPSIETLNLAELIRPVSSEKPSKSSKHSKKDKKSPEKGKSSKEKSPKKLGAQASTVSAFSDIEEDASPPPSRGANAASPVKSKHTEEKSAEKDVDELDPTGSMRFAAPSKFARQNPSLLMQQPSRVLQKVMEEQEVASAERKLISVYHVSFSICCSVFYWSEMLNFVIFSIFFSAKKLFAAKLNAKRKLESAVIVLKPNIYSAQALSRIVDILENHEIKVTSRGILPSVEKDRSRIVGSYLANLVKYAELTEPSELPLGAEELAAFQRKFGVEWKSSVGEGRVLNARAARKHLAFADNTTLDALWQRCDRLRLAPGLYCGRLDAASATDPAHKAILTTSPIFVINGFCGELRDRYQNNTVLPMYLLIEWNVEQLTWTDVSTHIIGDSDPQRAATSSIRGVFRAEWEALGLAAQP